MAESVAENSIAQSKPMTRKQVRAFMTALASANPEPRTELQYSDAYTLLVAVVLSAQATDVSVNRATAGLFAVASTPAAMLALGEAGVAAHIRHIGLWRDKARHVIALSQHLIRDHAGEVPNDRQALEALPGVGRKTANVVLNVAFSQPTIAVDTHIFRIGNRTGMARGRTPLEVEQGLMKVMPPEFMLDAHHWLILHGRYVCKARLPECGRCHGRIWCQFPAKTSAE